MKRIAAIAFILAIGMSCKAAEAAPLWEEIKSVEAESAISMEKKTTEKDIRQISTKKKADKKCKRAILKIKDDTAIVILPDGRRAKYDSYALLCACVEAEAGGECFDGKRMVASSFVLSKPMASKCYQ